MPPKKDAAAPKAALVASVEAAGKAAAKAAAAAGAAEPAAKRAKTAAAEAAEAADAARAADEAAQAAAAAAGMSADKIMQDAPPLPTVAENLGSRKIMTGVIPYVQWALPSYLVAEGILKTSSSGSCNVRESMPDRVPLKIVEGAADIRSYKDRGAKALLCHLLHRNPRRVIPSLPSFVVFPCARASE